jgi:hypothetical protein
MMALCFRNMLNLHEGIDEVVIPLLISEANSIVVYCSLPRTASGL